MLLVKADNTNTALKASTNFLMIGDFRVIKYELFELSITPYGLTTIQMYSVQKIKTIGETGIFKNH